MKSPPKRAGVPAEAARRFPSSPPAASGAGSVTALLTAAANRRHHQCTHTDHQDRESAERGLRRAVVLGTGRGQCLGRNLGHDLVLGSGRHQDDARLLLGLGLRVNGLLGLRLDGVDRIDRVNRIHGIHRIDGVDRLLALGFDEFLGSCLAGLFVGELPFASRDEHPLTGLRVLTLLDEALVEVIGGVLFRLRVTVDDCVAQLGLGANPRLGLRLLGRASLLGDREEPVRDVPGALDIGRTTRDVDVVAAEDERHGAGEVAFRIHRSFVVDVDSVVEDIHIRQRPVLGKRGRDGDGDGRHPGDTGDVGDRPLHRDGRVGLAGLFRLLCRLGRRRLGVRDVGGVVGRRVLTGTALVRRRSLVGADDEIGVGIGRRNDAFVGHGVVRGVGSVVVGGVLDHGLDAGCGGRRGVGGRLVRLDRGGLDGSGRSGLFSFGCHGSRGREECCERQRCRSGNTSDDFHLAQLHEISSRRVALCARLQWME